MRKSESLIELKKLTQTNKLFAKMLELPKSLDMFYFVKMHTKHNVLALTPLERPNILRKATGEFIPWYKCRLLFENL